ncbi:hypothetical protein BYT27DRAFT_7251559 [Phlegmacium glaucopus]|nr:hypothetical protein BYT27DRAFT_7251559 [Phlegmacium glaucopus]
MSSEQITKEQRLVLSERGAVFAGRRTTKQTTNPDDRACAPLLLLQPQRRLLSQVLHDSLSHTSPLLHLESLNNANDTNDYWELFLSTTTAAMSHPISPRHDDEHYPLETNEQTMPNDRTTNKRTDD